MKRPGAKISPLLLCTMICIASSMLAVGSAYGQPLYRWVRADRAAGLKPGDRIESGNAAHFRGLFRQQGNTIRLRLRGENKNYRQPESRRERVLERARQRVAPEKPSRLTSVFATADPEHWRSLSLEQGRPKERRILMRVEPSHPSQLSTHDARYVEQVYYLLLDFGAAGSFGPKKALLRRIKHAADQYWTAPASVEEARPETLIGESAVLLEAVAP